MTESHEIDHFKRKLAQAQKQIKEEQTYNNKLKYTNNTFQRQAADKEAEAAELRARVADLESELAARERSAAEGAQARLSEGLQGLRAVQREELGR
eukprot:765529-Hanusia_phi.AAC.1